MRISETVKNFATSVKNKIKSGIFTILNFIVTTFSGSSFEKLDPNSIIFKILSYFANETEKGKTSKTNTNNVNNSPSSKAINSSSDLFFAVFKGNLPEVERLLKMGADPNILNTSDETALDMLQFPTDVNDPNFTKIAENCEKIVESLIKKGAEKHNFSRVGNTLLHRLSGYNCKSTKESQARLKVIKLLATEESDVVIRDVYGHTPLHRAASYGNLELVQYLANIAPNALKLRTELGETPLLRALTSGTGVGVIYHKNYSEDWSKKREVAKYLISLAPNMIMAKNLYGDTLLHLAALRQDLELCEHLMQFLTPKALENQNVKGKTPLHLVYLAFFDLNPEWCGDFKVIKYLANLAPEALKIRDEEGKTLLYYAISRKNLEDVKFLASLQPAAIEIKDKYDYTALDIASTQPGEDIFNFLLTFCDDPTRIEELKQHRKNLAFLDIVKKRDLNKIKEVIAEFGTKILDAKDSHNRTALHIIAEHQHKLGLPGGEEADSKYLDNYLNIIKFLETKMSKLNDLDKSGLTYKDTGLQSSIERGYIKQIAYWLDKGAEIDIKSFKLAVGTGKLDIVELFLNNLTNIDMKDDDDNTILHILAERTYNKDYRGYNDRDCDTLINSFLEKNPMKQSLNKTGQTYQDVLLACAVKHGYINIINYWIDHGANINSLSKGNLTLLDLTSYTPDYNRNKVVELLIQKGIKKNDIGIISDAVYSNNLELATKTIDSWSSDSANHWTSKRFSGGKTLLHIAAKRNFPEMIELLVKKSGNHDFKDIKDDYGLTCSDIMSEPIKVEKLHSAIIDGKFELFDRLLELHANLNAPDENGDTALHHAVRNQHLTRNRYPDVQNIFEYLARGDMFRREVKNNLGNTILHELILAKASEKLILMWANCGADMDSQNNQGNTALHLAIMFNNDESCVETLLALSPSAAHIPNKEGKTILDIIFDSKDVRKLRLALEQQIDPKLKKEIEKKYRDKLFFSAVINGDLNLANEMIKEFGQSIIDIQDEDGKTALHISASLCNSVSFSSGKSDGDENSFKIYRFLLSMGPNKEIKDNLGQTYEDVVYLSVIKKLSVIEGEGPKMILDYLENRVVNANAKTSILVLSELVKKGYLDSAKLIIGNVPGMNVNIALNIAASYGHIHNNYVEIIKALLGNDADEKIKNDFGQTLESLILFSAIKRKDMKQVRHIIGKEQKLSSELNLNSKDQDGNTPLHIAANLYATNPTMSITIIKMLIEKGASGDITNLCGETYSYVILSDAVRKGNIQEVEELLNLQDPVNPPKELIDANTKGKDGKTALHIAAEAGNRGVIALLEMKTNSVYLPDVYGSTHLDILLRNAVLKNDLSYVMSLVNNENANMNAKDKNGNTALSLAKDNNCQEILRFFNEKPAARHIVTEALTKPTPGKSPDAPLVTSTTKHMGV